MIRYAERIDNCTVLGPGVRAVLWVHGCCFDCKGCIADRYKNGPYQETAPEEMTEWYWNNSGYTEGITISGGEPFLQAEELAQMIRQIRDRQDCGVIVYTGFLYEELLARAQKEEAIQHFLNEIDLLIDGPYIEALDDNRRAVGSENQKLIPLTDRYQSVMEEYYGQYSRNVEIRIFDGKGMLVGVPAAEQRKLWERLNRKDRMESLESMEVSESEYKNDAKGTSK